MPTTLPPAARAAFASLVRRRRLERGLTQEELAARASGGLSVDTVAAIERGRSRPYRQTLDVLCAALDLSAPESDELRSVWRASGRAAAEDPARPTSARPTVTIATPSRTPWAAAVPAPPLTPLIGREADCAAVLALLGRSEVRLVTMVGPGGVGKTRVALALATLQQLVDRFPDGVIWVDLAPLRDPVLVLPTLAATLGLTETAGQPLSERLAAHLLQRRLLFVLDNCEQVSAAAPEIAAVLSRSPDVSVLATSRSPLRVRGEHVYAVGPLVVPGDGDGPLTVAALARVPAVALFVNSARAALSGFALTEHNAVSVAAICSRLDGLPLALELAAARLTAFAPDNLLVQLDRGLGLLSGAQDLPERQRTLTATLAWSYALLDEGEQALLRGLSVFARGGTFEMIEQVCGGRADGERGRRDDELPSRLSALEAHSLMRVVGLLGADRYGLLHTVREYGRTMLDPVEAAELGRRHGSAYLQLAAGSARALAGADRLRWLDGLEAERDNLRAALDWLSGSITTPVPVELIQAMGWFWYLRGPLREGRTWLEALLRQPSERLRGAARATATWHAGRLAHLQGDEQAAQLWLAESVAAWRASGSVGPELAYALSDLGQVSWFNGDHAAGHRMASEAVALFRRTSDRWGLALALQDFGQVVISTGQFGAARDIYTEILSIYDDLGDSWGPGLPLLGLGRVCYAEGDLVAARRLLHQSRAVFEAAGDARLLAHVLMRLGQVDRRDADATASGRWYREALLIWQELGNPTGSALAIAGLAGVAVVAGRPDRGARLAGAAASLLARSGGTMAPLDLADHEPYVRLAASVLGPDVFDLRWIQGRGIDEAGAVAEALAEEIGQPAAGSQS